MNFYASKSYQEKIKQEYQQIREAIISKLGGYCWHCGTKEALSCHHLIPVRYSGTNDIENLILVCLNQKGENCHWRHNSFSYQWIKEHKELFKKKSIKELTLIIRRDLFLETIQNNNQRLKLILPTPPLKTDIKVLKDLNLSDEKIGKLYNRSYATISLYRKQYNISGMIRTGQNASMYNKYHSKKTKAKMQEARLKRKKKLGYINSPETRKKMSKAKKENPTSWMTNNKPQYWIEAIKKANTGEKNAMKRPEISKKVAAKLKGKKRSKEAIKNSLRRRIPTSLELKFQEIINKYNLPYKYVGNGSFLIENCNPDFINIDGKKIAIEVYARFYKKIDNRNINKWKKKRKKVFKNYGWDIIFFDETEIKEQIILKKLS